MERPDPIVCYRIKVKGEWKYLYRAVDSEGNTIDFLLRAKRDARAAERFFRKALRAAHKRRYHRPKSDHCHRLWNCCMTTLISSKHFRYPEFLQHILSASAAWIRCRTVSSSGPKRHSSSRNTTAASPCRNPCCSPCCNPC